MCKSNVWNSLHWNKFENERFQRAIVANKIVYGNRVLHSHHHFLHWKAIEMRWRKDEILYVVDFLFIGKEILFRSKNFYSWFIFLIVKNDVLRFRPESRLMSDDVFFCPFYTFSPLSQFQSHAKGSCPRPKILLNTFFNSSQSSGSCSTKDAKPVETGAIIFLAMGNAERNNLANQLPRPKPDIDQRPL